MVHVEKRRYLLGQRRRCSRIQVVQGNPETQLKTVVYRRCQLARSGILGRPIQT